jgi:hypothetical protein
MNKLYLFFFLNCFFCVSSQAQFANRQVYWRSLQNQQSADTDKVVRVYLDKFGYLYPDVAVGIDEHNFIHPSRFSTAKTIGSANLYAYFERNKDDKNSLLNFYNVPQTDVFSKDYYAVQEKELQNVNRQVHKLVDKLHAKTIIFLIHGFNVNDPSDDYLYFENAVTTQGYDNTVKPVYIEIYWDGLSDKIATDILSVWPHAQNNTKWICLAVRDLMRHLTDRLDFVVVTHSLGASVGTGAIFNTSTKWKPSGDKAEVDSISASIPAPVDVTVRLGMIVPAIPGGSTFTDFNKRSPDISAVSNNIRRVVIGYNPWDYATSKLKFASIYGSTTLGCNFHRELDNVKDSLNKRGYSDDQQNLMIVPILFSTPQILGKYEDHAFKAYMNDTTNFGMFLKKLFE